MRRNASRREFLRNSSMAGVGMWIGNTVIASPRSPAEKLNVACIGVGGKGASDMGACRGENIVAICDTDRGRLDNAGNRVAKNAKKALGL